MTKQTYYLKLFLICALIGIFTYIGSISGCSKSSTIITLSKAPLMLCDKPIVLELEQPLHRTNKSLSIRMQLNEAWTPEPPWKDIKLQDGKLVRITVAMISDKGAHYYPIIIGAGGGLDIRFYDSVPNDARIVKILLSSTHPLTAQNMMWVDWNPK